MALNCASICPHVGQPDSYDVLEKSGITIPLGTRILISLGSFRAPDSSWKIQVCSLLYQYNLHMKGKSTADFLIKKEKTKLTHLRKGIA
jgi:hypothetical protein